MLRIIICAGVFAAGICSAWADDTCKSKATDKKLAGAALTSFMTKCQKDATAACDATAMSKKLAGAAKTSFSKRCLSDAVGT